MLKNVELVQALSRGFGVFWLISGSVQIALSILLSVAAYKLQAAMLSACAMQMGVFSISSVVIGVVLISVSGHLARFAAKPGQIA
ncbi:hypothetical protein PMI01_01978 [Caulobacter sp. AP07]|uniref:hypothetical protein n=1 Tax=Caulobacter sp. AP07 TaxID=1144304 RepID=UPI0002720156|nr:hypothetical protein [Caulobacter sp. AP07]EJL33673.1 hypothetical protein PMI01_01978 [Caulobacter sp. AP07]